MRTIDWYGIVAWLNWPTSDGRWSQGTIVARHMAPVLWQPETMAPILVAGVVRQVDASCDDYDCETKPRPVRALLRLDMAMLAMMQHTMYPEVDYTRSSLDQGHPFQNPVIAGITLGTNPAWSNLDPVVRDDSKGLLFA